MNITRKWEKIAFSKVYEFLYLDSVFEEYNSSEDGSCYLGERLCCQVLVIKSFGDDCEEWYQKTDGFQSIGTLQSEVISLNVVLPQCPVDLPWPIWRIHGASLQRSLNLTPSLLSEGTHRHVGITIQWKIYIVFPSSHSPAQFFISYRYPLLPRGVYLWCLIREH